MILCFGCALKLIFLTEYGSFTQYCLDFVKAWNNKSPIFSIHAHFCVLQIFLSSHFGTVKKNSIEHPSDTFDAITFLPDRYFTESTDPFNIQC